MAAGALLATLAAGCGGGHTATRSALRGLVPRPLPRKPSFVLTDTSGRPYSLAARTRGKLTYLYFGYTHCPDICPTTVADLASALRKQPPPVRNRVAFVFITVDPKRDTPHVLRRWLDHFNHSFVGLTGKARSIFAAERAAGVPVPPALRHGCFRRSLSSAPAARRQWRRQAPVSRCAHAPIL